MGCDDIFNLSYRIFMGTVTKLQSIDSTVQIDVPLRQNQTTHWSSGSQPKFNNNFAAHLDLKRPQKEL